MLCSEPLQTLPDQDPHKLLWRFYFEIETFFLPNSVKKNLGPKVLYSVTPHINSRIEMIRGIHYQDMIPEWIFASIPQSKILNVSKFFFSTKGKKKSVKAPWPSIYLSTGPSHWLSSIISIAKVFFFSPCLEIVALFHNAYKLFEGISVTYLD